MVIINKITECQSSENINISKVNIQQKNLQINAVYMQVRCKKENRANGKRHQSYKVTILLLLILSNDIHPNPGPKPQTSQHCSLCKTEVNDEDSLKCETCKKSYHIKCTSIKEDTFLQNSSFQWICPNQTCKPNHKEGNHLNDNSSTNRYQSLEYNIETPVQPLIKPPKKKMIHTKRNKKETKSIENQILSVLPKISPKDYQGKDLCRKCFGEVKMSQQAISCDICDRWTHRSCSDMSLRVYKECRKKKYFPWSCNNCRTDEVQIKDTADVKKLDKKDLPEDINSVKTSDKEILIINMNCRSAVNKVEEIKYIFDKLNPDICCLTETWFDDSVPGDALVPAGYNIIRKDRSDNFKQKYCKNRGGGIAVLYKQNMNVIQKDYLTDKTEEILWVQVRGKHSFMLGTLYRSEYTDILDGEIGESKIEENIRKATELSDRLIVTGDLNIDVSDTTNALTQSLQNIYKSYGLIQLIQKPTRIDKTSGKPTIIDHVWVNAENSPVKCTGTFIGVSDHLGTYIKLNLRKPEDPVKTIRHRSFKRYSSEDYSQDLKEKLSNSSIEQYITNKDVNGATEELIKVMQETAEEHAPMKTTKIKTHTYINKIPWYTKELKNQITVKNNLVSDFCYYGSQCFKDRIKIIQNSISHLKRKLKKNYLTEKIAEAQGDMKKCWKILDHITNRKKAKHSTEPDMLNQEKVNTFNNYFATIGIEIQRKLNINLPTNDFDGLTGFNFKPETEESVVKLIDRIKIDVATGNDDIGAKLIKDAKLAITPILTQIINIGYETAIFPDCMKHAIIKAIHKKNDTEDISNYRPISILPTLSKVFERAATDQLVTHLEKNKLLCNIQHAYRKFHSTKTCLFEVVNHLYKLTDQKKRCAAVVSLDLSKAFDSINHPLILHKLSKLNLSENTLSWVGSYLTNRKQRTKFQSFLSDEKVVTSGVPQGSIIGPLLFLCFTNDLCEAFENKCKMAAYADDTQLIVDAKNLPQLKAKIEEIIKIAQQWYTENSMKNNISKTEILIINKAQANMKNEEVNVNHEGKQITLKPQPFIKILGVFIDSQLNWKKQVNHVKKKALNTTRCLHRVNHLLPIKEKINLYNALIVPHFDYADIIWGGCGKTNSSKLQIVQNFAAKSITGNKKSDSATASLQKLKFLTLNQRRTVHESIFAHKSILQINPTNINTEFLQQQPTSSTRHGHSGKLNLPKHRTSKYEDSPLYRSIKSWNCIPNHLPTENPKILKTNFQKYLISETYHKH